MTYIILDIEWNQPLSKEQTLEEPMHLLGEIVQIGAVKLNNKFQRTDSFKIAVRPKYYTKMNKRVEFLTKITDYDLLFGSPFPEAFLKFKEWCGEDFMFLTWGYDDIPMLRDNLKLHGIKTDWIPEFCNLQIIFNNQIMKQQRQYSLSSAVKIVNETEKEAHDALNDAINTYQICKHLDMKKGIADYKKDIPNVAAHRTSSPEQKTYSSKKEAMSDLNVISFKCPVCGKTVYCRKWITQNTGKKISIARCKNGEAYFVRLKFSKSPEGRLSVRRIIYEMTDEYMKFYKDKKAALKR